jgi:putative membrane protein
MIILGWAVVIIIGVAVISWALQGRTPRHQIGDSRIYPPLPAPESPRQILDRRFAAGEIDIEEYAERRAAIEEPFLPKNPGRKPPVDPDRGSDESEI